MALVEPVPELVVIADVELERNRLALGLNQSGAALLSGGGNLLGGLALGQFLDDRPRDRRLVQDVERAAVCARPVHRREYPRQVLRAHGLSQGLGFLHRLHQLSVRLDDLGFLPVGLELGQRVVPLLRRQLRDLVDHLGHHLQLGLVAANAAYRRHNLGRQVGDVFRGARLERHGRRRLARCRSLGQEIFVVLSADRMLTTARAHQSPAVELNLNSNFGLLLVQPLDFFGTDSLSRLTLDCRHQVLHRRHLVLAGLVVLGLNPRKIGLIQRDAVLHASNMAKSANLIDRDAVDVVLSDRRLQRHRRWLVWRPKSSG